MNVKENEMETNVLVDNTGSVVLFRSMITDITCNLDLTYFPFDQVFSCFTISQNRFYEHSTSGSLICAQNHLYTGFKLPITLSHLNQSTEICALTVQ